MNAGRSLPAHVLSASIVLDEVRLIYVPIPKAGSTTVLWGLLDLVDIDASAFTRSPKLEATRALTIHDLSVWGSANRFDCHRRDPYDLFTAADWLAFTVVRDPVRRLWSAWVSKILVRDPRFVRRYGGEAWFPGAPRAADEVVDSFRAFLAALVERPAEWHDPHWVSQTDLAGADVLPYDLVARIEDSPSSLAPVARHLELHGRAMPELRRENASLLPYVDGLLGPEGWEQCAALTARDREAFGYPMPEPSRGDPSPEWAAEIEARLPGIRAVSERNERIGDLKELLTSRSAR